jgi:hypothetical protein
MTMGPTVRRWQKFGSIGSKFGGRTSNSKPLLPGLVNAVTGSSTVDRVSVKRTVEGGSVVRDVDIVGGWVI